MAQNWHHAKPWLGALRGAWYVNFYNADLCSLVRVAPEPHILLFRREKDYQEKVCTISLWHPL